MGDEHTPGDWDFDNGFIVAPDPAGKHPDIYIAEIATEDDEDRFAPVDKLAVIEQELVREVVRIEQLQLQAARRSSDPRNVGWSERGVSFAG